MRTIVKDFVIWNLYLSKLKPLEIQLATDKYFVGFDFWKTWVARYFFLLNFSSNYRPKHIR